MKKISAKKDDGGFTLVELILVILLAGILAVFTIQFLSQAAQVNQINSERKELVDLARLGMEAMVREIRTADPATVTFTATSISFDKQFAYPVDTNVTGISYTYDAGTGTLQRTGGVVSPVTVASQVSAFTVASPSAGLYTLNMTVTGTTGGNYSLQSAVRPRTFS
ncbi:MAG: prepilin-type N-terminal cleavage/methylation domain-containing protein [Nitrospinaceae bacterium]|nr:prepilin-type N-terminal cleavage/methylation domain-containing protein [Nitrospinaceae bacterium]NIR53827.1 prepilin-type N-terminal cleavage/methylation domain-containing protein [Nitrospinaceae bacterium]NIS84238.1 prepilin-type N-terminal cleavage/methylation domain-containing protein [Nitrospinaceae bacterium]NIT81042.1 prepilin-type N-terminal cleavage/methylation domain-containing protein [Nitrospinaceae bacterium]NIU43333.1 prepilin-type N-terminal cleavage/methylation domain-contain